MPNSSVRAIANETQRDIPFNRPHVTGAEIELIAEAIRGRKLCGDGPFSKRCEELLSKRLGGARCLLTTSCTHALEMIASLLDIQRGDEVLLPSFTFVSTANPFVMRGAAIRFVDVEYPSLNT